MNKITAFKDYYTFRIYFDGILHLIINLATYDGIQSYAEGSRKKIYLIDINRKNDIPIELGYDRKEDWKKVLQLIDENI